MSYIEQIKELDAAEKLRLQRIKDRGNLVQFIQHKLPAGFKLEGNFSSTKPELFFVCQLTKGTIRIDVDTRQLAGELEVELPDSLKDFEPIPATE